MRVLDSELGMLLELALNKALGRDPVVQQQLAKLAGQSLLLRLSLPPIAIGVMLEQEGVRLVGADQLDSPSCEIEGAPSELLALMLDPQLSFENRVQLRGNTQLANQLRDLASQLDLDWGGLIGDYLGDPAAQLLVRLFSQGRQQLHERVDNLLDDLDNWLHEEIQVQPGQIELEDFYQQVDQLRLDADRLQARIDRLASKTEA